MKRWLIAAPAALAILGVSARYLPVDFVRPNIERALERGLGRKVQVGEVHLSFLTGLGFTIDGVTIHEDARAGIEPFMYVETLEARVRMLALLKRRLQFSSLHLAGDTTAINLVKTESGPWNFQFLLGSAAAAAGQMPEIKMRGGRVNFKFGDTKSILYFNDADLDVSPYGSNSVEVRFSGAPSRTDRSAQNFGHFFVRGNWNGERLDMRVELERSALDEVARLLDQRGFGVHGVIAMAAQLSGSPSHLEVAGQMQLDDIHRWDLLPKRGGGWKLGYKGTLDLRGETLVLESTGGTPNPPLALHFRAADFLSRPRWEVGVDVNQVPLATLFEVVRHMGAALPEKLAADGSVSGAVQYSEATGATGRIELQDGSLTLPEAEPLSASTAAFTFGDSTVSMESSTVRISENESAEVEGRYGFGENAGLDLKITTRGLSVAGLRPFGLTAIPIIDQTSQGTWKGWARYRIAPENDEDNRGEWSGEYELQNARIAVDGLADPVRIQSAAVSLNGPRVAVTRIKGRAGDVAFTGEYRLDQAAPRRHRFKLAIPEADAAELQRLFAPALQRDRSFLARALRLGAAALPEWLSARKADGSISINALTAGDKTVRIENARVVWDGPVIRFTKVNAKTDPESFEGDVSMDLSGRAPRYHLDGNLRDVAYGGGKIDFDGTLDSEGSGIQLLTSLKGEGRFHGRSIAFAPEADFRTASGWFEVTAGVSGARWKITNLEVLQNGESYVGNGVTQPDGKLVLELANRGRQFKYTGPLAAAIP
jgi:hypothetical protein